LRDLAPGDAGNPHRGWKHGCRRIGPGRAGPGRAGPDHAPWYPTGRSGRPPCRVPAQSQPDAHTQRPNTRGTERTWQPPARRSPPRTAR
jgi:hypothetical protein